MRSRTSTVTLTLPRLRAVHRCLDRLSAFLSQDIGGVLKGGVKLRQRNLINQVSGSLATEFPDNLLREGATPVQRACRAGPFKRIWIVQLTRHSVPTR
jgi:hypothetical protein